MSKKLIVLVHGYIRHEAYEQAVKMLDKHRKFAGDTEYEVHAYPSNSEGYQTHVVSNAVLTSEEVFDAGFITEYVPDTNENVEPIEFSEYLEDTKLYAVGIIHGYESDGIRRYQE